MHGKQKAFRKYLNGIVPLDKIRQQIETLNLIEMILDKDISTIESKLYELFANLKPSKTLRNENDLRNYIELFARFSKISGRYNIKIETLTGLGFADVIFEPINKGEATIIIELKMGQGPVAALNQIKKRQYIRAIRTNNNFDGEIYQVGLGYYKNPLKVKCKIVVDK